MELQVMDRTRILDLMGELKLFGMRGAFDEVMTSALKRQHERDYQESCVWGRLTIMPGRTCLRT